MGSERGDQVSREASFLDLTDGADKSFLVSIPIAVCANVLSGGADCWYAQYIL